MSGKLAATTVTLGQATVIASTLEIYRNGLAQELTTDYTLAAGVVTFTESFAASGGAAYGETVKAVYRYV